jgi:ABC-type transporter Mla MlaB component
MERLTMLRITRKVDDDGRTTLKIEGTIAGEWVGELRRSIESSFHGPIKVAIDLSDVSFVDAAGVALLHELRDLPVEILGATAYVSELLRGPRA